MTKQYHSHSADVTADRLGKHYEDWYSLFKGRELDDMSNVIYALRQIAEGERGPVPRPSSARRAALRSPRSGE